MKNDKEVLLEPLEMSFWRASIDNDFGAWKKWIPEDMKYFDMRNAGKEYRLVEMIYSKSDNGEHQFTYEFSHPIIQSKNTIIYTIDQQGVLSVRSNLNAENPKKLKQMPRYGIRLALDQSYNQVEYYGRGPFENYVDRNTAAHVGRYTSSVSDFYVPYIRPQENGYRTDVREVTFRNGEGNNISFIAEKLISFSAHHNPLEDFDPGNQKAQKHSTDINPKGKTWIHVDYMQKGVGGDDSWSKNGLANSEYLIDLENCELSFGINLK